MNAKNINPDGSYNGIEYVDMNDSECAIAYENGKFVFKANLLVLTGDYPVTEVTWAGANAFCAWAGVAYLLKLNGNMRQEEE